MDCVESFYKELKRNNSTMSGQIMGGLLIEILFGYIPMMYPAGFLLRGDPDVGIFMAVSICMLGIAVFLYMRAYAVIGENGKTYSVVEKLRYIPVSPMEIKRYLRKLLSRYCLRIFIVSVMIQCIGNGIAQTEILIGVLYAVVAAAGLWLVGYLGITKVLKT